MKKRTAFLVSLLIGSVAFVVYLPALKIQFYDGWWYLQWAATMNPSRYLIQFLDPANITQGYRPVQGLYIYLLYHLFGFNPDGYHLAHTFLHAANAILLFFTVHELGKNFRVALVAALLYAVSPVYSLAVFWHAVVDPLAAFFYLLTLLLWIQYLKNPRPLAWGLAFAAFVLALFSKEIAVFLPLLLFLIEWWFLGHKPDPALHIRRYAPFIVMLFPYLWLVLQVQSHGEFVGQFGFHIGPQMVENLLPYLAVLAFPWTTDLPKDAIYYAWLAAVGVLYLGVMIYKRSKPLLFLGLVAVLNISPLTGFPQTYFNTRYLYLSTMVSAIVIAFVLDWVWGKLPGRWMSLVATTVLVAGVLVASGARVAEASDQLAEFTRQMRVPFRDISQRHPTFPQDTYLYFLHSPTTPLVDLQGLFLTRYGTGLTVQGTDDGNLPELREHNVSFLYYFDETGKPIELPAQKSELTHASAGLPAGLGGSLVLERYQVPSATVQQGKALAIILEWSVQRAPSKAYAVFAHLLDQNGQIVASRDGPPLRGETPTTKWKRGQLYVDAVVLPIHPDVPMGDNYRLELGMYDPATMERLPVVDAKETSAKDAVTIGPFQIVGMDNK